MAVSIVVMLAVLVIPGGGGEEQLRLRAAAAVLISDIEMAQVLTISSPSEPVVVRFDESGDSYWLAYADAPDTPISRQMSNEPYFVVMGHGRALGAAGVRIATTGMSGNMLQFNALGGLADFNSTPVVQLQPGNSKQPVFLDITIAPTTGTITDTFGSTLLANR